MNINEQGGNDADLIASVFELDSPSSGDFTPPGSEPAGEAAAPAAPAAPTPTPPVAPAASAETPAPAAPAAVPAPAAPTALPPLAAPTPAPAPGTPPATPAAPAAPAAPSEEALRLSALEANNQALQAELQRLRNPQQQQQAPGTPATPTAQPEADATAYALSIPDQLSNAIFSEDAAIARQGMTHLVNSLAQTIHSRLQTQFRNELQGFEQRTSQQTQQQDETRQIAEMQQQYYGLFPAHNNPVVKQIVAQQAGEMATQYPGLPWNEQYVAALGSRVNNAIAALTGTAPAAPPVVLPAPTTSAAPAPRPAAFAPTTPRSPIPAFDTEEAQRDVIADTFKFGD